MSAKAKILVIRFSAMGDVAMTAPVLREFKQAYPDTELIVLSRSLFKPFFKGIKGMKFHAFEPKKQHKGFIGLLKLFAELRREQITAVADLHNNLRSLILCILFFLGGVKLKRLDKGRSEKKKLSRKQDKELFPLRLTTERYAAVFASLGFPFTLSHQLPARQYPALTPAMAPFIDPEKKSVYIGVSPFAQHAQKVYPLEKMENVVLQLAAMGHRIFIFGGGDTEKQIGEAWALKAPGITSVIGKLSLENELDLIAHLDLMISMDSSGMHMASLKGVPVVSVWGATHPYAGFMGYGQSLDDAVQISLPCRPCAIYGNKPCFRGDFACMNNLPELSVLNKVIQKINGKTTPLS